MKRDTIGRGRRKFYLFITHSMAAVCAVCIAVLLLNSYVNYQGIYGSYDYMVKPSDQNKPFEESGVFTKILNNNLTELARMVVVSGQMESNGSFDSRKPVDITAYANRKSTVYDKSVTATYCLDDLIKWGSNGFTTQRLTGTWADLCAYFAKDNAMAADSLEISIPNRVQGTDTVSLPEALETADFVPDENALYEMELLVPRYLSADGLDLKEYARTPQQYEILKKNLMDASQSLAHNFEQYSAFREAYDSNNTNVRYCYQVVADGHVSYFTNVEGLQLADSSLSQLTERFASFGRYVYFNPDNLEIKTNTKLDALAMRASLEPYDYVFSEGTRVWLAVDTAYPAADDFRQGRDMFSQFMPYYWQTLLLAFAAFLVGTVYFGLLCIYEGRKPLAAQAAEREAVPEEVTQGQSLEERAAENKAEENKNVRSYVLCLKREDKLPGEICVLLLLLLGAFSYWILALCLNNSSFLNESGLSYGLTILAAAVLGYLICSVFTECSLSLVRRIKCRRFWQHTAVCQLWKFGKKVILEIYDNGELITKGVLPFLGIAVLNVLVGAGLFIIRKWLIFCGLLLLLLDGAAAYFLYRENRDRGRIVKGIENIRNGDLQYQIDTENLHGDNLVLATAVNSIGAGIRKAVETSMKDERLKAALITNVSHDIKTPLTSIINFVNLLKRENIQDQRIRGYVEVLDAKSQRLKQLTDDLVEASKISSGNITLKLERINLIELVHQTVGEFSEKFQEKQLTVVANVPEEPMYIQADGRYMWRVLENLLNNIYKYALEGTRVYLDMEQAGGKKGAMAVLSVKNISASPLNIKAEELTERFVRGDDSRGTEGSGLGLSIARNLTELQKGRFSILLDGDLFKVVLEFPVC